MAGSSLGTELRTQLEKTFGSSGFEVSQLVDMGLHFR